MGPAIRDQEGLFPMGSRPFLTTNQTRPLATEAGAANIKRTLHPNPSPVEFNSFETNFVPFPVSSFVKLSLQVGQASAETNPSAPTTRATQRIFATVCIFQIYLRPPPLASVPWDASTSPSSFSKITRWTRRSPKRLSIALPQPNTLSCSLIFDPTETLSEASWASLTFLRNGVKIRPAISKEE